MGTGHCPSQAHHSSAGTRDELWSACLPVVKMDLVLDGTIHLQAAKPEVVVWEAQAALIIGQQVGYTRGHQGPMPTHHSIITGVVSSEIDLTLLTCGHRTEVFKLCSGLCRNVVPVSSPA